jgi:hypothetical protein
MRSCKVKVIVITVSKLRPRRTALWLRLNWVCWPARGVWYILLLYEYIVPDEVQSYWVFHVLSKAAAPDSRPCPERCEAEPYLMLGGVHVYGKVYGCVVARAITT